jgi:hypothetical protein
MLRMWVWQVVDGRAEAGWLVLLDLPPAPAGADHRSQRDMREGKA